MRKLICCMAAACLAPVQAFCAPGRSALQFLTLRPSARAEALGGALTASGDDLSSLSVNPATLSRLRRPEALFTQAVLFEDIKFSYASYAQPTRFGMPSIEYMAMSYGDFDSVSRDGQVTGKQSPKETYAGFGWSTKRHDRSGLFQNLDLGANFRFFKSDLGAASASGISANLGALYQTPMEGLAVGAAVNHLGGSVKYAGESISQPRAMRLGLAYSTNEFMALASKARFSADGVLPKDGGVNMGLGAEILFGSLISLQAGYAGEENLENRFRFGLGMGLDAITLNYSAAPLGDLGTAHRITVRMRFGQGVWNILSVLSGEQAVKQNLALALQEREAGNQGRAALYAHRVLKRHPENYEARELLNEIEQEERAKMGVSIYGEAVAMIRLGLYEEAEEKIRQCLELDPGNDGYQTIHATVLAQIKRDENGATAELLAQIRARAQAEEAAKAPAVEPAQVAKVTEPAAKAAPIAEPAPRLDADSQAEYDKSLGLIQEKKLDEAIGVLRTVVERNRRNETASLRLAECLKGRGVKHFAKGRYEDSYEDFKEAAALNPKDNTLKKFVANVEQIMESLNLKPTIASYRKGEK